MQQTSSTPPDLQTVVDSQSRAQSSSHDVVSVRTPLANGRVRREDFGHLLHRLPVPNVDGSAQVTKTGDEEQTRLGLIAEEVSRGEAEIVNGIGFGVEEDGFGGHVWTKRK
jgi:hypothetical protein